MRLVKSLVGLIALLLLFTGCDNEEKVEDQAVYILGDQTDTVFQSSFYQEQIISCFKDLTNLNKEVIYERAVDVNISPINESKYPGEKSFSLDSAQPLAFRNDEERLTEQEKMLSEISSTINQLKRDAKERELSQVMIGMNRALKTLNKSAADKKTLIVNSDLLENSTDISFYSEPLKDIENCINQMLEKEDFSSIYVYVIYNPSSENRETFERVFEIWKKCFLKHNIQCKYLPHFS